MSGDSSTDRTARLRALLAALVGAGVLAGGASVVGASPAPEDPPARALSREFTSMQRLAGTVGSLRAARYVRGVLVEAGWSVEFDEREVVLSLPRRLALAAYEGPSDAPFLEQLDTFDADAIPPGDVPRFNAWSASARANGPVVDVGRGLRADYERVAGRGVDVRGAIAIARYGGAYRGVKAQLAEEHGCAGLLLFSDPADDGAERGAVWPDGPWKPGWAAQRGSISPMAKAPGDPSTPGWPSAAPGDTGYRLDAADYDAALPRIPVLPIGADAAAALLAPDDVRVELDLDVPRELRTIRNVVARLAGSGPELVVAGNHRDAWVRGAHDAGSGTVSLLRAAQRLGARARAGWTPPATIVLGFWDAEESGLIGSTEWGEAHGELLREHCVAYVNADAVVSGTSLRLSGAPGLGATLQAALERVPHPHDPALSLFDQWNPDGAAKSLGLPGSGSDYTVFLHHLAVPILDLSFGGNGGGQYHTSFDDFAHTDRFLDPDWVGHETAGRFLDELLYELAERGPTAFDPVEAAQRMAHVARALEDEADAHGARWCGDVSNGRLVAAFERLRDAAPDVAGTRFLAALEAPEGLPERPWFRNRLWAPGLETGYASETFPTLRAAARVGVDALAAELDELVAAIDGLAGASAESER